MKKIFILILLLLLTGCTNKVNEELWDEIVNNEYSADNGWAGMGIYFYEEDEIKYCDYMLYGSGVYVAGYETYTVIFEEENKLLLTLTEAYQQYTSEEYYSITLIYEDGIFKHESSIFEDKDFNAHDHILPYE